MELREGDTAKNQNSNAVKFGFLNSPAKFYSATRQGDTKSRISLGRPAGGPYIQIFGRVPLPQFHIA